jgi:hypothetical protein
VVEVEALSQDEHRTFINKAKPTAFVTVRKVLSMSCSAWGQGDTGWGVGWGRGGVVC